MAMESSKPHIVIVSSPGVGHLGPDLELGNWLVAHHKFQVTFFVVLEYHITVGESQLIQSAKAQEFLHIVELPPMDLSGRLEPNAPIFMRLTAVMREIRETLRSAISSLKPSPSALVVDIFGTPALDVADEVHMLKYVFVYCAWPLALMLYAPILDKEMEGEYVDQKQPIKLPGCMALRPEDILDPMMDRTKQEYYFFLGAATKMRKSDGILMNSWEDLDAVTLKAIREEDSYGSTPVYTIGPLIKSGGPPPPASSLCRWLDEQPLESVLYIAFGSLGVLSAKQITELAWGMELSQQRFIWVLRPPSIDDASALAYLPDGFLERIHNVGLVVTQWAPQSDILGHPSTGGFLSHCGWNSSLESILSGVPMIAWPLYAEQKMNATMLAEEVGVAIRPKVAPTDGVVGRDEVEMMVRKVIEGHEGKAMRTRVKELKISGEKALTKGGSSFMTVSQLGSQWAFGRKESKFGSIGLKEQIWKKLKALLVRPAINRTKSGMIKRAQGVSSCAHKETRSQTCNRAHKGCDRSHLCAGEE